MAAVQQQGDGEDEDKDKDQNAAEINVDNPAGEVYQDRAGRFVAPRTKEIAMRWRFLRPARRGKRIFLSPAPALPPGGRYYLQRKWIQNGTRRRSAALRGILQQGEEDELQTHDLQLLQPRICLH